MLLPGPISVSKQFAHFPPLWAPTGMGASPTWTAPAGMGAPPGMDAPPAWTPRRSLPEECCAFNQCCVGR